MDELDSTVVCIARKGKREGLAWASEGVLEWQRKILEVVRKPEV
jgi:hypothetical protein